MKRALEILVALAGCYLAVLIALFCLQRRLIFPAPAPRDVVVSGDARLVQISTATGLPVFAVYFPAAAGHSTLVHFHGNGEQLADTLPVGRMFQAHGLGFFAVEYPGYGAAASATATEPHLYEVAEAALHHLHDVLQVPVERTIIEGHSLGTGVAAEMARRGLGAKLVLASPFTSMADVAALAVPWLPVRGLVRDRFDTLAKASAIHVPTLIVHGRRDELVPLAMGQLVAANIRGAALAVDDEAGHNDLVGSDWYIAQIVRFADAATAPASP